MALEPDIGWVAAFCIECEYRKLLQNLTLEKDKYDT